MFVCLWPLLKLLDLAVLVVLWWCKTRRGAILAVLVVLWGVRWVLVVLWGSGGGGGQKAPSSRRERARPAGA